MKDRYILLLFTGLFLFLHMQINAQDKTFIASSLQEVWRTPQDFNIPECVLYDPERKIVYVSNISGKPGEEDGDGFIARLSLDGTLQEKKWITGLDAPKGMALQGDRLFVSDIDELVVIDIEKGKVVQRHEHPEARFLNDVVVDGQGRAYVSDMLGNKIYRLTEDDLQVWSEVQSLTKPNGLLLEDGRLLVGMNNTLASIGLSNRDLEVMVENTGSIDGLRALDQGQYLISDWNGRIHRVEAGKEKVKLLDTTPLSMNAADMEYIPATGMLLVPTFRDNRVIAYELTP